MAIAILVAFIIGYGLIAFEHPLKIDKAATALLTGIVCWLILTYGIEQMPAFWETVPGEHILPEANFIAHSLFEHLGSICEILFFLIGAMTIVELVDAHDGFRVITDRITTENRVKLLWIIAVISFFLSAVLDNMTTAIIMCAMLRRIIRDKNDLWLFGGFVIIAANAGGAWSPIGDVTTIMLWIGGQVTSLNIIQSTFLASVASLVIPLLLASYFLKKQKPGREYLLKDEFATEPRTTPFEQKLLFILGCLSLLSVPVFKTVTHLPPYMGVLLSLSILWIVTEIMHRDKESDHKRGLTVNYILQRIDTTSILFFLGILLAVGALETSGHLKLLAEALNHHVGNIYYINTLIGLLSAIVDNVPLVAASMGMYDLSYYPPDHNFWELLAYCAGTGGSILIIGSAAGVASMGILKMDFLWYLKRISLYALIGYFAGIGVYYLQHHAG
jgi:Na+/H+ antiporter NhaD/arsenite permease-like protein